MNGQYIPAQPGLQLAVLIDETDEVYLEPIIAWMIPDAAETHKLVERTGDIWAYSPWAITPADKYQRGDYLQAIVYPDGRVYEPGWKWHVSVTDWVKATADRRKARQGRAREKRTLKPV